MLVLVGDAHDLCHLGLGDFVAEYTTNAFALGMHLQHDLSRSSSFHTEYRFEDLDDEFHWREIVVDQQYPVQRRGLHFRLGLIHGQTEAFVLFQVCFSFSHKGVVIAIFYLKVNNLLVHAAVQPVSSVGYVYR